MSKLKTALNLAKAGFYIHPLIPNSKKPATRWKDEATTDASIIRLWWETNPEYNIGIATEYSGLSVLDVDMGPGKDGEASLERLKLKYSQDLFNTFTVRTRSGGYHFYYWGTENNSASAIDKDIDVRGIGGYVVGPGSAIDGSSYDIEVTAQIQQWPNFEYQKKEKLEAVEYTNDASLPPGGRNNFLIAKAGSYRRQGDSDETIWAAINAINDRWNDKLEEAELRSILKSSMKFIPESKKIKDSNAVSLAQLQEENDTDIDWLVEGLIKKQSMNVLVSQSFVGKSYLCRDLVRACTNGEEFLSRATKHVYPVLWIGGDESRQDFIKSCSEMRIDPNLILFSDFQPEAKLKWLKSQCKLHIPSLVIIDSYSSFFGGNFNLNEEVNPIMQGLKELSHEYNLAVILIHHTSDSKNAAKEYMGATSFKTQSDTFLVMTSNEEEERFIKTTKCRMGKQIQETKLYMDDETFEFSIENKQNPEVAAVREKICELLGQNQMTKRDMRDKLSKKQRFYFCEAFDNLYTTNKILPSEDKTYFLARPMVRKSTAANSIPKAQPESKMSAEDKAFFADLSKKAGYDAE